MHSRRLQLLIYLAVACCLLAETSVQASHDNGLPEPSTFLPLMRWELSRVATDTLQPFYSDTSFLLAAPQWRHMDRQTAGGLSQRAVFEIGAVTLTGAGHFVFRAMDASKVYIPLTSLGWGGYVFYRVRKDKAFFFDVGFTSHSLGGSLRDSTLVALGATALMAGTAASKGSLTAHRDMIPLFFLYPAWGLVQQFLVQGMVAKNLSETEGWLSSPYVVTLISASLFGSVHLPNWKLTAGTFALGAVFTPIYLRYGNLWPLGLYHGWLGALFYFWVLEQNPWKEIVGKRADSNIRANLGVGAQGSPMLRVDVIF